MEETTTAQPEAEVFEFKHPKTHRTLTLPKMIGEVDLKGLLEGTIEKSKVDEKNRVREQMAELESKVKDFDAVSSRLAELETSGLTAAQKATKENERILKQAEGDKAEAARLRASLHTEKVNNAVFRELGNVKGIVDVNKAATLFNAPSRLTPPSAMIGTRSPAPRSRSVSTPRGPSRTPRSCSSASARRPSP